jgi:hypothetical protein
MHIFKNITDTFTYKVQIFPTRKIFFIINTQLN